MLLQHHKGVWAFLPLHTVFQVFILRYALATARKTFVLCLLLNEHAIHLLPTIFFGKYSIPHNVSLSYHQQETKIARVTTAAFYPTVCRTWFKWVDLGYIY